MSLLGCSNISTKHVPPISDGQSRKLLLFLDGTANDANSRTNVAKLHSLVTLQDKPNIATLYVDGVGTERTGKLFGMGVGVGNAKRVREAYLFLAENYRPKDKIYIFGFSRGAWSSRVLAAMLYVAGLPDIKHLSDKKRKAVVDDIYDKYKKYWSTFSEDNRTLSERREAVIDYLKNKGLLSNHKKNVNIQFLGLWDTVQALGIEANSNTNVGEPNKRYADQLCNIHRVAHAVSLDDNRFKEFTPLLFMQDHFNEEKCIAENDDGATKNNEVETIINEVWFSGAHSDVGGGYDDTTIDGVSLNWMLNELKNEQIFDSEIKVYASPFDKTHNPNQGLLGWLYRDVSRDMNAIYKSYAQPNLSIPGKPKLTLHQSVLDRLCAKAPETFESTWFRDEEFEGCVVCDGSSGSIAQSCKAKLAVAADENYKLQQTLENKNYCDVTDCELSNNGQSTIRNENPVKSCNLSLPETSRQAQQRLQNTVLDGEKISEVVVTYFNDRKNDHTGVFLKKGITYRITVDEVSRNLKGWSDCSYESGLSGRDIWDTSRTENSWYSNFLGKVGTVAILPTFEYIFENLTTFIGKVNNHSIKFHDVLNLDLSSHNMRGSLSGTFTVPQDGELILTVNEPFWNDLYKGEFFNNNAGVITFKLGIVKDAL